MIGLTRNETRIFWRCIIIGVCLTGVWHTVSAAVPSMIAAGLRLSDVQWAGETLVWLEGRGAQSVLVAQTGAQAPRDLTDTSQSVRGRVGYGGGEFTTSGDTVIFAGNGGRLYRLALDGLIVDETKMAENLNVSRGLIVAEAVMMGLAPQLGRQEAHDVVYDACRLANEQGATLADALSADPRVSSRIDRETIDRLTSPKNYLGLAPEMVDRVLASTKR